MPVIFLSFLMLLISENFNSYLIQLFLTFEYQIFIRIFFSIVTEGIVAELRSMSDSDSTDASSVPLPAVSPDGTLNPDHPAYPFIKVTPFEQNRHQKLLEQMRKTQDGTLFVNDVLQSHLGEHLRQINPLQRLLVPPMHKQERIIRDFFESCFFKTTASCVGGEGNFFSCPKFLLFQNFQ